MDVLSPGLSVVTRVQAFSSSAVSHYPGCLSVKGSEATGSALVILGRTCVVFVGFEPIVDGFNNIEYVPLSLSHSHSTKRPYNDACIL